MPSDKKITKEDTWRPADLRRHIREDDHGDDYARRRDDTERKHRGGGSIERRHREPEESRRDRDKLRERESTRVREDEDGKERYSERRKEGSQSRKRDKDKDRRDEMDTEKRRLSDDEREKKERRRERHEKREREREKDRHKDKEKEMERDKKRHTAEDRDKRREDKDKERRREERDREHRSDTRRLEESGEGIRDPTRRQHREHSDRQHRNDEEKKKDRDLQERQEDGKHSQRKEDKEYKEERRRRKEERERRHKERGHPDEIRKHENESREHLDFRQTGEELRRSHGDRDRGERDKHRERRKKVEDGAETRYKERKQKEEEVEDVERNLRDTTSSKKSSSDKSHKHEKKDIVAENEDLAEEEYEDDFEKLDYEEDFEEMDESTDESEKELLDSNVDYGEEKLTTQQKKEIEAIKRAMAEENERAGTAQPRQSTNREEEDTQRTPKGSEKNERTSSQRGKFIDFVTAKQREVSKKVASKQKKRSTELLRLIDLDFSTTACLLDLPPISEYELYIRSFGNANTKQAYVQCNEDNVERDVQTEEIEISEKWTQHPPERSGACGDPNVSQDKSRSDLNIDSKRLISFLHSASQVMVVLLEEDQAERNSQRKLKTQTDSLSFSGGSLELNTNLPFLYGRRVSLVHFSEVQRHTMMSVHMPAVQPSAVRLDSCTIICIWNIWERSRPQKILIYESAVQCCCFSPGKATQVFAGTSVGSVVLWDLREYASDHYRLKIGEDEWTFRHPTFSTDSVMAATGHYSPVTAVEVVPSIVTGGLNVEVPFLASEEESSGLSFQLASLDESGLINFWVVVELPKGNEAGSPADLGLRPGGKVKLLHSSSLLAAERVSPRDAAKKRALQTQLLKFLPTDSNHFFVGTNLGLVNHGTSHGLKAPPKFYRFQEVEVRPVNVTSIHFSPFKPHLFLVGCEDGSIRLHAVSHEQPVAEWRNSTAGEPVVSLQWSLTRSAVFSVLDAASNLHVWDLLKQDVQPVVTERISADRVTTMAVFGDSGKKITFSGVALAHESGKIELHFFTNNLTVSSSAEEEKLDSLLIEAF